MAAQNTFTLDLVPPRRASLDDLGGKGKTNNTKFPPNAPTQPTAEEHNQWAQLLAYLARSMPVLSLSVSWNGSAYVISSFAASPTAAVIGSFTLTNPSTGVVRIVWPAANGCVLPPPQGAPALSLNAAQAGAQAWVASYVDGSGNPGVQITLPANGSFRVDVY